MNLEELVAKAREEFKAAMKSLFGDEAVRGGDMDPPQSEHRPGYYTVKYRMRKKIITETLWADNEQTAWDKVRAWLPFGDYDEYDVDLLEIQYLGDILK